MQLHIEHNKSVIITDPETILFDLTTEFGNNLKHDHKT